MKRAFTLVEVVVVMAIVMILAAIMFPVFRSVKASAIQTACLSNFKQGHLAMTAYTTDYSDSFPIVSYTHPGAGEPLTDRTWVQLTLPYAKDFRVFLCPGDYSKKDPNATFDRDLVVGDVYARYYEASKRSNLGYNSMYLAPVVMSPNSITVLSANSSMVGRPARTLLFVDSVHDLDSNGRPVGGGSHLVVPPCRYTNLEAGSDTFWGGGISEESSFFQANQGWTEESGVETNFMGGAWPWHNGRMNIINVDGSADSLTQGELERGCEVRPNFAGTIHDTWRYLWDLN
ncbi:MAG TPA: prepilin-type N-terminal cleavage/methylation domain-containing protein [Fimbriimonadaceae bacterium]|nr:prepilin-type N-terminal cleavage/methylation domain-containing protein [Fimbriimonadaceae bacterium]HRJ32294.1 prepilin-type N-terminal cleavage/methylation domain-containing protein [Fimbriimonadaceae bacterium]